MKPVNQYVSIRVVFPTILEEYVNVVYQIFTALVQVLHVMSIAKCQNARVQEIMLLLVNFHAR